MKKETKKTPINDKFGTPDRFGFASGLADNDKTKTEFKNKQTGDKLNNQNGLIDPDGNKPKIKSEGIVFKKTLNLNESKTKKYEPINESKDVDFLGIVNSKNDFKTITEIKQEISTTGVSFMNKTNEPIPNPEFKQPKSKGLNLKTRSDKNNNDESVKKMMNYFPQNNNSKNANEDSLI